MVHDGPGIPIQRCYYCGRRDHPMPVYRLAIEDMDVKHWFTETARSYKPLYISVCHHRAEPGPQGELRLVPSDVCRDKATADGYVYDAKRTPTR